MALAYSSLALRSVVLLVPLTKPLNSTLWRTLTEIGISRARPTRRGCRAGQRKRRLITTIEAKATKARRFESRASQQVNSTQVRFLAEERCGDKNGHLHTPSRDELNIHFDAFCSSIENNPIVTGRPSSSAAVNDCTVKPLILCSVNVRSTKSKSADLQDYIFSSGADLFALTETWLNANNTAAKFEFIN